MSNSKFRLTEDKQRMIDGTDVYRIEALQDFNDVKVGDLGGFLEREDNLSFEEGDNSWVYDDSVVYGDSVIEADSIIYKDGMIKDSHVLNGSRVAYDSTVEDSLIQETQVQSSNIKDTESFSSTVGQANIEGSKLVFSVIGDTKMKNTFIESSETSYGSIIEDSHIEDRTLRDVRYLGHDTRLELNDSDLENLEDDGLEL